MPLQTGIILNNRYRVVRLLGQGGFGAVYRAWDMNMDSACALKENLSTTQEAIDQFKREAQILYKLRHANLPIVIDHFSIPGQGQYLVMDYVEGEDLQEMLERQGGPLPESRVLPWIEQVCDALSYLHAQNPPIIHRDIKPANIKITPEGRAALVDFGIAKVYDPGRRTLSGARALTEGYAPPEQYAGKGKTDIRTDIYALGATLYALLTGRVPEESVLRISNDPLIPAERLNPSISPQIANAISQAMQPDPERRPTTAKAFKKTLKESETVVSTLQLSKMIPTQVVPNQVTQALQLPISKDQGLKKWLPWVAGLVVVVIAIVWGMGKPEPKPNPDALAEAQVVEEPAVVAPDEPTNTSTWIPDDPTQESLAEIFIDEHGVPMVLIPAGAFQMGVDADIALKNCQELYETFTDDTCERSWFEDEGPLHTVTLPSFYLDQYEVNNGQYAACVQAGDCKLPGFTESGGGIGDYGNSQFEDYPVVLVSWNDANDYCQWHGGRLPTEEEWEKAARGGEEGRLYPWGDDFDGSRANFCDQNCVMYWANPNFNDGYANSAPVGSYGANGYGLFDMAGNVWEWVFDWYDVYPGGDPSVSSDFGEIYRVYRGGSYIDYGVLLRVASRIQAEPDRKSNGLGFRCARSP